jgi:excisionase family DNA binding protein
LKRLAITENPSRAAPLLEHGAPDHDAHDREHAHVSAEQSRKVDLEEVHDDSVRPEDRESEDHRERAAPSQAADRPNRPGPALSVTFQTQRTVSTSGFLTVREAAERLRVSRATVYREVADGRIAAVRVSSGAIRIPETALPTVG